MPSVRTALYWLLGAVCIAAPPAVGTSRVLYDRESEFNRIIVREDEDGIRELVFGTGAGAAVQSAMAMGKPDELLLPYTRSAMCGLAVVPRPKNILIIGLGGASMPRFLRRAYPNAAITIAELDPGVAEVAKKFFDFREDARMKVRIGDGRKLVESSKEVYDLIFLDAYGPDSIPYALATREFLRAVRERLSPDGAVVANLWSQSVNRMYPAMVRTYQNVFDEIHVLRVADKANRILIALPRKEKLTRARMAHQVLQIEAPGVPELDLAERIKSDYEAVRVAPGTKVLLDADEPREKD